MSAAGFQSRMRFPDEQNLVSDGGVILNHIN
jgi:hypothetical protein